MNVFPEELETDRLTLKRFCMENVDLRTVHQYYTPENGADEIFEQLNVSPNNTIKETYDMIRNSEREWEEGDRLSYIIEPKNTEPDGGEFAGSTLLNIDWDHRTAKLGIWLRKPFWGRGYSAERAGALTALALDTLQLDLVAVEHTAGNTKAKLSIEKYISELGGQYDGVIRNGVVIDGEVRDKHRYTILASEFTE